MQLDTTSSKPIFQQIAEFIEDMILNDEIEDQVYSTNQLSKLFTINPATARKGLTLLLDQNIIYKKRGIGMFVSEGAKTIILEKRQGIFFDQYIHTMMSEAKKIGLDKKEIIEFINNYKGGQHD